MCEGDTLAYIAEMFDVTVEELKKMEWPVKWVFYIHRTKVINNWHNGKKDYRYTKTGLPWWNKRIERIGSFWDGYNSPSSNILGEGLRLFTKFFYDGVNAPVIWITGHTLGGFSQTPQERAQAFMDFAPTAFIGGALRILGPCSKINSGLNGYNAYVKSSMYKQNLYKPKGQGWQKEAGKNVSTG